MGLAGVGTGFVEGIGFVDVVEGDSPGRMGLAVLGLDHRQELVSHMDYFVVEGHCSPAGHHKRLHRNTLDSTCCS